MKREELKELCSWGKRRDGLLSQWLERLILLGSGSLSILVSLRSLHHASGAEAVCLKGAWATLGLGILLAALRLYGAVWMAKTMVEQLETRLREPPATGAGPPPAPISCRLPWYIVKAELASYVSFLLAVVLLVAAAIMGT